MRNQRGHLKSGVKSNFSFNNFMKSGNVDVPYHCKSTG